MHATVMMIQQKQPSCEKMVWPQKAWVKKVVKIKGGGNEMVAMMLMLINLIMAVCIVKISINIIAAIFRLPPLISQLFSRFTWAF